jgi:hypothetical protein
MIDAATEPTPAPKPPRSWKTTAAGVLSLLSTAAMVGAKVMKGEPLGPEDLAAISMALSALGLILAKDGNK